MNSIAHPPSIVKPPPTRCPRCQMRALIYPCIYCGEDLHCPQRPPSLRDLRETTPRKNKTRDRRG